MGGPGKDRVRVAPVSASRASAGIDLSIVIPTYRGEGSLESLADQLAATLDPLELRWELILVNDASPDNTWTTIQRIGKRHPQVHGIDLLRNHGQPTATMCGLAHARGRLVATMDDDLQHPPDQLPRLLEALADRPELDAVVGSWARDQGPLRNLGSWVHGTADRLAHGTPKGFRHSAFRLIRRPAIDAMLAHQTRLPVVGPLLTQVTTRVANVDVRHDVRAVGSSNFRLGHGLRAVTSNFIQGSTLPLRVMSVFGLVVASLAFLGATALVVQAAAGTNTPPGWVSVFLATIFFGGTILVQIGLVGQYIHVIVKEVSGAPRWMIRETTELEVPSEVAPEDARRAGRA